MLQAVFIIRREYFIRLAAGCLDIFWLTQQIAFKAPDIQAVFERAVNVFFKAYMMRFIKPCKVKAAGMGICYQCCQFIQRITLTQDQPAAQSEASLRLLRSMMADLLIEGQTPDEIRAARPDDAAALEARWGSLDHFAGRHFTFHQELDRAAVWAAWQNFDGRLLAAHGSFDWVASEADHRLAAVAVNADDPDAAQFVIVPGLDHAMTAHETLEDSFANAFQGEQSDAFHTLAVDWLRARAGE